MNGRARIIAEAGVNHNGEMTMALQLIDAATKAGADAIKFQTFRAADNVSAAAELAAYQRTAGVTDLTQLEMLTSLELGQSEFARLKSYADERGIEFLSTPDDPWSIEVLLQLGVAEFKIASAEIDNHWFLRKVGETHKRVILSTGMSNLEEVREAIGVLEDAGAAEVALLHCTSCYPCPSADANLRAIRTLKEAFGKRVGYSDHTIGVQAAIVARALGADILEKHITLDHGLPGPDHAASADPKEFEGYVKAIRLTEMLLGDGDKRLRPCEKENITALRRSIVAARNIALGHAISEPDIALKRPGTGISPSAREHVLGRRASRAISRDEIIGWDDLV